MTTTDQDLGSEPIDVSTTTVEAVLLSDGWHHVRNRSFRTGPLHIEGTAAVDGFHFNEGVGDHVTAGPLSSILAVRYQQG